MKPSYLPGIEVHADPYDEFACRFIYFGGFMVGTRTLVPSTSSVDLRAQEDESNAEAVVIVLLLPVREEKRFEGPEKTRESIEFINEVHPRISVFLESLMGRSPVENERTALTNEESASERAAIQALTRAGYALSKDLSLAPGTSLNYVSLAAVGDTVAVLLRIDPSCDIPSLSHWAITEPHFSRILRAAGALDEGSARVRALACFVAM